MQIIDNLSQNPVICVIISVIIFLICSMMIYLLLDAFLKMHRSKSAVKKLKKGYTFRAQMWLRHAQDHCLHAVTFCKCLILFQRAGWLCFAGYLLIALANAIGLASDLILAWATAGMFILYDVPVFAINTILARPIIGRFKEFSFEKYHNTNNHDDLL